MNWGFIGWCLGIILTVYVLKFAILALRSLFSKRNMESIMMAAGDKVSEANEAMTRKIKETAAKRKAERRQRKIEEDQPMIIIR